MKKSFLTGENPALQFISGADQDERQQKTAENASQGKPTFSANTTPTETKSERVQLLMRKSLRDRLKKQAAEAGLSFNEYVNQMLDYLSKEL